MNTATIWRTALERLEQIPIDGATRAWLRDAHLDDMPPADSDGDEFAHQDQQVHHLLLHVSAELAQEIIDTNWRSAIEDVLVEIIQQPVMLSILSAGQEIPLPAEAISVPETTYNQLSPSPADASTDNYAYYDLPRKKSGTANLTYVGQKSASDTLEDWDNEQRANMLMHNRLNSRYTFDAFIVGNSNRLAHAASLAVAEAPGESYNPLFLYGGVGLGKTHLLHAIGHLGVQNGLAVLYVSSEQFTNEIVNAIRYRTTDEFRAKYRSVDILLVDDIQFIAGKESTEEEFFHTFNSLYEMSKQIVICSDRPPKAIVSLEERLRSRFEWGLIADIQPPDLETRMAILRVKADLLHYHIPDEIIAYIAGRVQTNIRELEGCLNRLMAYQQLHRVELTMEVARAAMSSLGNDTRETSLSSYQIAEAVAEYYHVPLELICGKQRDKHIVVPRQIAMYLIRQETQASLLEIGQLFGGRDHSTVLHACEKIDQAMNTNVALRREVIAIREQLMRDQ